MDYNSRQNRCDSPTRDYFRHLQPPRLLPEVDLRRDGLRGALLRSRLGPLPGDRRLRGHRRVGGTGGAARRGQAGGDGDQRVRHHLSGVADASVDAIVMDPPYYDNVQYSELSDFYYVWQKRTLGDLYPEWFAETVTDKSEEAVANPARDGSARAAKAQYETLMRNIFAEGRRVLRPTAS
ncbi:MAG: hypothetical protein U5L11_10700 [Arhodomonas sp.]|nr:hypothetical protein [Arhodomonas sp.]